MYFKIGRKWAIVDRRYIYRSPNCSATNSRKLIELINLAVNLKYDDTVLVGDFKHPNISWKDRQRHIIIHIKNFKL